jgi:hypothetical protein
MSAHHQSSGPRGNAYSESKFTNWTRYDPFFAEVRGVYKRFDSRLPDQPAFPRVIALAPLAPDFMHACKSHEIEHRLRLMPGDQLSGLRAVFLLSGTRKQQLSWHSSLGCYGMYWRACVFICAHPFGLGYHYVDEIRDFYLNDVLIHELAHHVDRRRASDHDTKEGFAHAFVQRQRA